MLTAKRVCMYVWQQKLRQAEGFWNIHTWLSQNVMKLQKPSQGDGFWVSSAKSPHREGGFETHTYSRQLIVMLVCMFQKCCACGGFFKTPLPVEGFWLLSWYVCMRKDPHRQMDFGYLDHPPYPPSQILKNQIKRQILKGFRKESDLVSGAWFFPDPA